MITLKQLKQKAKHMKENPTSAENRASKILKKAGIPYNQQKIFGFYILDFLIPNRLLVLEIDGKYHIKGNYHDKRRDEFCKEYGLNVLRVRNEDVEKIVKRIRKFKKIKGYKALVRKAVDAASEKRRIAEVYFTKNNK